MWWLFGILCSCSGFLHDPVYLSNRILNSIKKLDCSNPLLLSTGGLISTFMKANCTLRLTFIIAFTNASWKFVGISLSNFTRFLLSNPLRHRSHCVFLIQLHRLRISEKQLTHLVISVCKVLWHLIHVLSAMSGIIDFITLVIMHELERWAYYTVRVTFGVV